MNINLSRTFALRVSRVEPIIPSRTVKQRKSLAREFNNAGNKNNHGQQSEHEQKQEQQNDQDQCYGYDRNGKKLYLELRPSLNVSA